MHLRLFVPLWRHFKRFLTMPPAHFYFHGDLNDFLPLEQRATLIPYLVDDHPAVKHPIESLGVPHPEVEAILVDGRPVSFMHRVQPGDAVHVYSAASRPPDVAHALLRPPLPSPIRFLLDTHLGKLATYLRMLGIDAAYSNDADDDALAQIAAAEERVLLTRDRGLLKRKLLVYGYCVRNSEPRSQLIAVLHRYHLHHSVRLWSRCLRCNGLLEPVEKALIDEQLEPKTRLYYDQFERCSSCGQVYWQGSHHEQMQKFVESALAE